MKVGLLTGEGWMGGWMVDLLFKAHGSISGGVDAAGREVLVGRKGSAFFSHVLACCLRPTYGPPVPSKYKHTTDIT